jgi:hypothetical protein
MFSETSKLQMGGNPMNDKEIISIRIFKKIHNGFQNRTQKFTEYTGGNVNILGVHSIGHSKQKNCIRKCVLFRTVFEIKGLHCPVTRLLIKRYYVLFLILVFIIQVTILVNFT